MDMCLTLRKLTGNKESLNQLIFHTIAVFIRIPIEDAILCKGICITAQL